MKSTNLLLQWIKQFPKAVIGLITFITAIVGFIILFRDNPELIIVVITTLLFITLWIISFYISFAKTPPLIEGGKGVYVYPRLLRISRIISFFIIPMIIIFLSYPEQNRTYIMEVLQGASDLSLEGFWNSNLSAEMEWIPSYLIPIDDKQSYDKADQYLKNHSITTFDDLAYPDRLGAILYDLYVQNNRNDKEWIRISHTVFVSVTPLSNAQSQLTDLNFFHFHVGGGGLGYETFPPTPLTNKGYQILLTDSDANSFYLQPGEYDDLMFEFDCKAPGAYKVGFEISYMVSGVQKSKSYSSDKFVCPIIYTIWSDDFTQNIKGGLRYYWYNGQYVAP